MDFNPVMWALCKDGGGSGGGGGGSGGGDNFPIGDGNTHFRFDVSEYRKTIYLGFGINGTVTIDWGDGSTNNKSGSNVNALTTVGHTYKNAGEHIISLFVDGEIGFLRKSSNSSTPAIVSYMAGYNSYDNTYKSALLRLTGIELGNAVTNIGEYAFCGCGSFENVDIPSSVTNIGQYAFEQCRALRSVGVPSSVTSIGNRAFGSCDNLRRVDIPSGVTNIGQYTFVGCSSLEIVTVSPSVTNIGSKAFNGAWSVTEYDFSHHTSIPTLESVDAFGSDFYLTTSIEFRIPAALYDEWVNATNWSVIASKCTFTGV